MSNADVHLVGSIPLPSAADVFQQVSAVFGGRIKRIRDGETRPRLRWIMALESVFADNPSFEKADERYIRSVAPSKDSFRYKTRAGIDPTTVRFGTLPDVQAALDSYKVFARLKREGKIRPDVRFQVALANPFSVVRVFVVENQQAQLEPVYTEALKDAVGKITNAIPHGELAIQWDVASGVFERLERGMTGRFGSSPREVLDFFGRNTVELGNVVPAGVELIFHLCYGDNSHKHTVEPSSMTYLVDFANHVAAHINRPVHLYHMPVPRDRSDAAYFVPLNRLSIASNLEVALGLVHMTDGFEGTLARAGEAKKHLREFLISTECGFGRRPPEQVPQLLRLHADVAGKLRAE